MVFSDVLMIYRDTTGLGSQLKYVIAQIKSYFNKSCVEKCLVCRKRSRLYLDVSGATFNM